MNNVIRSGSACDWLIDDHTNSLRNSNQTQGLYRLLVLIITVYGVFDYIPLQNQKCEVSRYLLNDNTLLLKIDCKPLYFIILISI